MEKTRGIRLLAAVWTAVLASTLTAQAQSVVMKEDFSGERNIFGITATQLAVGSASIYDTGLSGFGRVLAVCNTTAEGTITGADGQAVAVGDGTVTVEWDAFHGYFGNSSTATVTLLNSDGAEMASYTYNTKDCKVTAASVGGQGVVGFEAFALQSKQANGNGAAGFGGNGKPYAATEGYNPHVAVTLTARGGVTLDFTLRGTTTTLHGSVGNLTKDIAKMRITSTTGNSDRCYAIDNMQVTTGELQQDANYIEPIIGAIIAGADRMTFGPSPDEAFSNEYTVMLTGADGTTISETTISEKVTDFKVTWDIEGFRTANDTEGQYCDSYGAFSINGEGKVQTTFDLRDIPMNFFGKLTATVTYNGTTTVATKYVVAQGDAASTPQVLPLAGYPTAFTSYPDALIGYQLTQETYGSKSDLIVGGWCVAGSDSHSAKLLADGDGTKYVRLTAVTAKKSHVMTQQIETPAGQLIFLTRLRFNNAGAVATLTSGYPFWSSSKYTCPVTLKYDGTQLTLNGTALTSGDEAARLTTGTWYDIVLSADKSSERCYAKVYATDGQLLGESSVLPWAETSSPTYFSIGMDNANTGSVDLAACEAYVPTSNPDSYTLVSDKATLSIPQGETARLTASVSDTRGNAITGLATWTVVEADMQQHVIVTADEQDSHQATVTLSPTAEAGTATVQVSIGGSTKTLALNLTSSAESIRFTQSTTSISIPMDDGETTTAHFVAVHIDGEGNEFDSPVTLAAYDRDGMKPFADSEGISFDGMNGLLTVASTASPTVITIRATTKSTLGDELSKNVRVNIHGMKFDFGLTDDGAVAEGFTPVGSTTSWSDTAGYGIVTGTTTAAGSASATDAKTDYLQGSQHFDIKVQRGNFYTVEVTYQGVLTTGYVNSDLAGYTLGTHETLTTDTYTIPGTRDVIDLYIADADATHVAQLAQVSITKQAKRQKRGKRVVHHIGDSTSANNGSWAYRLSKSAGTYPALFDLCNFQNNGAGGRNLSTYYTQGKLAGVLRDIYPDDVVMFGNNGTNGMGNSYEADMNYYLDAAEALGAKIIINSYTPHGAVSGYAGGYNATAHTFDSYRKDSYETIVRKVAAQRQQNDANYLGFVEIGKNADAIFNAYVADYAANCHATADAAAQAIITCFADHNHYNNGTLACDLMLNGYATATVPGIVAQLTDILNGSVATGITPAALPSAGNATARQAIYTLTGQRVTAANRPGLYIINGRKYRVTR